MDPILESLSPADPSDVVGRFPIWNEETTQEAVARARDAQPRWRDAGLEARTAVLRRFAEITSERTEELARLIAREVGKAIWDARAEARLLAAKVGVTLDEGLRAIATQDVGGGARATHHPRGVLAVLGPFNFPAHLPNGHIVPALATGNSVVFKPSDQAPAVGDWMARAWRDAGLPPGVLELVQGGAETGRHLAVDCKVDAVLFTGSWSVGRSLKEATLDQPGKLLALEMGGRNAMLVLEDAHIETAVSEAALSMCATTGQRCTSLSRLFVHRSHIDEVSDRLATVLDGVVIGPPLEETTFMGPLISRDAWDRVQSFRGLAKAAGGERVYRREMNRLPPYCGPSLVRFDANLQTQHYQREEIFGPECAIYPIDDLDEGIACVNDSDYGLAASVMTRNREHYERCIGRVRTGILNWNKGTIGASGKLPFGGGGRSGNDRPAGISAALYCTSPQAHLESDLGDDAAVDSASLPPGMPAP